MKFKNILSFSVLAMLSLGVLVGCEDDSATESQTAKDYVSIVNIPKPVDVPEGQTITTDVKVYAGHVSNVDRVLNLEVIYESTYNIAHADSFGNPAKVVPITTAGADEFSVPATVTIPAGSKEGTFQVTLTDVDLGYGGKQIVIGIVPEAGIDQAMSSIGTVTAGDIEILNKRLVLTARRECVLTSVSLEIVTDRWGSETEWQLYDSALNVVAFGGPYADVAGSGEKTFFCLEDGNYTFVITDSENDGMGSDGKYTLTKLDADGNEVVIVTGGQFTSDEVTEFSIP
jgi:hypothetical protein